MPTHTPSIGLRAAASSTASSMPESRSSRMQSRIAPWPGSTMRSAAKTCSALCVMTTFTPLPSAALITAWDTDFRLPMP